MTTKTNNITVTINGTEVCADMATIASLLNMSVYQTQKAEKSEKRAKAEKAESKRRASDKNRAKHDAILDSKRVERMTQTAINAAAKQGFACKASKQGQWIWLYPDNGQGRTAEFKAVKLAKGWKHSMKRGAFYRDFSPEK